jgi:hypothetical protein
MTSGSRVMDGIEMRAHQTATLDFAPRMSQPKGKEEALEAMTPVRSLQGVSLTDVLQGAARQSSSATSLQQKRQLMQLRDQLTREFFVKLLHELKFGVS